MAEGYTIKLSQATFSESIGKWLEGMTPAARHALLGAGIGGTTLAMRRLMSRRDKDHKKRGVLSQALLGALLGGTAGYGLSSAFGGGVKPNTDTKADKKPGAAVDSPPSPPPSATQQVATKALDATAEGLGAVGSGIGQGVGALAEHDGALGLAIGGGIGAVRGLRAPLSTPTVNPNSLDTLINTLPPGDPMRVKLEQATTRYRNFVDSGQLTPKQKALHTSERLARQTEAGGKTKARADKKFNKDVPTANSASQRVQAYAAAPWYKKILMRNPRHLRVAPEARIMSVNNPPKKKGSKAPAPAYHNQPAGAAGAAKEQLRTVAREVFPTKPHIDTSDVGVNRRPPMTPGQQRAAKVTAHTVGGAGVGYGTEALIRKYLMPHLVPEETDWGRYGDLLNSVITPNK